MTNYREILRLHSHRISQRSISSSLGISRNTVSNVIKRANQVGIKWPFDKPMSDKDIASLLFPRGAPKDDRLMPDYEMIHKAMQKEHVTLKLLWMEYIESCKAQDEQPLMYTQFCLYYRKYAEVTKATMHITRKPAEQIEVDWAGQTLQIVDSATGELIPVYIFVGVLSYSLYTYVEGFISMDQDCWIDAHVHMYRYFGGVTRLLIPDNLKTGVHKIEDRIPEINKAYQEMAEYYDTVILPARVKKPQDKPNAENAVKYASNFIIGSLRNQKCFSLFDLNQLIQKQLTRLNTRPFTKKQGSRQSIFLAEEKPLLAALPTSDYERATWKTATVQFNYHIQVEKMHYSVPHEYIKHQVEVRLTRQMIEVFYKHTRICSHPRLSGTPGQYSTQQGHMPLNHQAYLSWDKQRFINWSIKIGVHTHTVIERLFSTFKVEQQAYQRAMAILKLGDRYGIDRLEGACRKALTFTSAPTLKVIKSILSTSQDKVHDEKRDTNQSSSPFGFTRGADYYGGGKKK
jgi:transposase